MSKLRSWQVEPAHRLLDILRHGNAVDLSDTGTGKTYVACAVASAMKLDNILAVVPKIAVSSWLTAAEHFGVSLTVGGYERIRTGLTGQGRWENPPPVPFKADEFFLCESCQCKVDFEDYRPCHCHPNGTHCIKTKKHPWKYGKFIWDKNIKLLILDEIHRCSGLDSLNAGMLIAAKRQGIRVLGLSATAACTPLQMRALGYVLGLHGLNQNLPLPKAAPFRLMPTFYQWAGKYDCRPDPVYRGLKWFASAERQKTIMADIHSKLIPERGVRVRTEDIPNFPERQIIPQLYDIQNPEKIDAAYAEATPQHPLTEILRARQRAEFSKVGILVELAEDYLAKGNSVPIFVNFRATLEELRKRLSAHNPVIVDGSAEGVSCRDAAIASFQRNDNRVILLNSAAGGVAISLHDLHGGFPRVGLVSPSFSAVEFRQVCGRLHRAGAKSPAVYKVILVAGTIEAKIKKSLDQKLNNLDSLTDGDLIPI